MFFFEAWAMTYRRIQFQFRYTIILRTKNAKYRIVRKEFESKVVATCFNYFMTSTAVRSATSALASTFPIGKHWAHPTFPKELKDTPSLNLLCKIDLLIGSRVDAMVLSLACLYSKVEERLKDGPRPHITSFIHLPWDGPFGPCTLLRSVDIRTSAPTTVRRSVATTHWEIEFQGHQYYY